MTDSRRLLQHFLGALAYRTQKALRDPLADAMTHAGQLAMLRRVHGTPVPSENFIFATVSADNVSSRQALPAAPDLDWRADEPPHPPGPRRRTGNNAR